ncbi:hypothetical protein [Pontibacter russatus]|uniref:hypothetical protein n=1 Tax=Pontibacter russatus TaxID=2694929 RepID=UPI001379B757|nr:hypothetical protein [Pontibacter russatus]
MKKFLLFPLFLCLFLTSCKDEEIPEPEQKPGFVDADIKKQVKYSSGFIGEKAATAIIHIWDADSADFDVEASGSDLRIGYAYDKVSGEYKTSKYGSIGSRMSEPVVPGKYFIYVVLMKSSDSGSMAYSYTYFDVAEGKELELKKTFSHDVPSEAYEPWEKNK